MLTLEQLLAGVVIPFDKPRQWSSFQAVNKVKAVIRNKYDIKKFKIGHAGTLDPLATGLLLICVGRATKQIEELQQGEKVYSGTIVLGATTPCHDLERPIDHYYPFESVTKEAIETAAKQLTGEILQVPPIFSAVKIDGQRAYQLARADDPEATIAPKKVIVHEFQITNYRPGSTGFIPPATIDSKDIPQVNLYQNPLGNIPEGLPQVDFRIRCGKGTYIRSIARDMGISLGCGALLSSLRREEVGHFSVNDAYSIETLEQFFTQTPT